MAVEVARVDAGVTLPLRQRILRPHQTVAELAAEDDAEAVHFAALDGGDVVGVGLVQREVPAWGSLGDGPWWRLRGMATDEAWRNRGVGAAVLDAVVIHVREAGGGRLWCEARTPALSFYVRAGFATHGEAWVDPLIGPHVAMHRLVEPD